MIRSGSRDDMFLWVCRNRATVMCRKPGEFPRVEARISRESGRLSEMRLEGLDTGRDFAADTVTYARKEFAHRDFEESLAGQCDLEGGKPVLFFIS